MARPTTRRGTGSHPTTCQTSSGCWRGAGRRPWWCRIGRRSNRSNRRRCRCADAGPCARPPGRRAMWEPACARREGGTVSATGGSGGNGRIAGMSLLQFQGVDFSVGGPLLLERVDLSIEAGERVCIVGRNGAGKSTLMRLMAGELRPDDGEIRLQGGVVVARMAQEVPQGTRGTVFDVVAQGLGDLGRLLARYHHALHEGDMDAMGRAQAEIEVQDGWDLDRRVQQVLDRLELPEDADFAALSGGMKRRVLLGQALV